MKTCDTYSRPVFEHQSTLCMATGAPCSAAERMVRELASSMAMASPFVTPAFELRACGRLEGCERGCTAEFCATVECVRIFCGIQLGETDM